MKRLGLVVLYIALMILVLAVEYFTNIDVLISDHFYDFTKHEWAISPEEHLKLSIFFYNGAKGLVTIIGTTCVLYMLSSIRIKKWRWNFTAVLTVLLCTMTVSAIVGKFKKFTNVYCPNQVEIYEGKYPYIKIIEKHQENSRPEREGRCFPAGHVTGAFSLMSLYLIFEDKKKKYVALAFAVSFGVITGGYQMLRGEHFLSHTLFSMLIAAAVIIIINSSVKKIFDYTCRLKTILHLTD